MTGQVLSGAMHKDVWYLPGGASSEAIFLKNANVNYLWEDTTANGSLALSFETVLEKAQNADLWLSPSSWSIYSMKVSTTRFGDVKIEADDILLFRSGLIGFVSLFG